MYDTGERSEPEKNYQNKIKTTFGPPILPIKPPHKTPPLTNLRGGPDPGPPLWIRACAIAGPDLVIIQIETSTKMYTPFWIELN